MEELNTELTPETEETTEQIELEELTQEEFTETIETVEETQQPPTEYTEAIYNVGTFLVNVNLFCVFVILGLLTITRIIGRAKL